MTTKDRTHVEELLGTVAALAPMDRGFVEFVDSQLPGHHFLDAFEMIFGKPNSDSVATNGVTDIIPTEGNPTSLDRDELSGDSPHG
jgi:hypothetical protein